MPLSYPARRACALALTLAAVTACGADEPSTVASAPQPIVSPTVEAPPAPSPAAPAASEAPATDASFSIAADGATVTGDTGRLKISAGDTVRISVTSTTTDEVHLHGYDVKAPVGPGQPAELVFDAKIPGVFEVELENSGVPLASLQVS